MQQRSGKAAVPLAIVLSVGLALAMANVAVLLTTVGQPAADASAFVGLYRSCPPCLVYFVAAPLVIASVLAIVVARTSAPQTAAGPAESGLHVAPAAPPSPAAESARISLMPSTRCSSAKKAKDSGARRLRSVSNSMR